MRGILAILFVALAVLAPGLRLMDGLPVIRAELILIPVALLKGHCRLLSSDQICRLLFAFGVIALIAITMSYTVFGVSFNANDLIVIPMLVQYWLIYCYWKGIAQTGIPKAMLLSIAVIVTIAALVGIAQKYNLAGVNGWLTPYYLNAESDQGQWTLYKFNSGSDYARVIGTVGDPRHFAYVLAFGVCASLAWIIHRKRLDATGILCGVAVSLAFTANLLCQSRTGLGALGILLGFSCYLYWKRTRKIGIPILVVISVITIFVVGLSQVGNERLNERLFMSASDLLETSGYARVRDFKDPFVEASKNPLVLITGMGPAKSVLPGSEHGEMGWVTLRFGLGGLFIYLAILYLTMKRVRMIYSCASQRYEVAMSMFLLGSMSIWCIYWLPESIFKNPQLMSLNMMVVGLAFGLRPTIHRGKGRRRALGRSRQRTREVAAQR